MKISTLITREPFESIFEDTLESFLLDWTGCKYTVKWEAAHDLKASSNVEQIWYCNPLINSIFVDGVDGKVFDSINGEYASNPLRPWRSGIQLLYLKLSQSKFLATALAKYRISISPQIADAKQKLIIGGNTKIRLIDIETKSVCVLLKDGFDSKYIERELFVRTEFPYLQIPAILQLGTSAKWYREEYVSGQPPNRLEKCVGDKALSQAVDSIHRMLNQSQRSASFVGYLDVLDAQLCAALENNAYLDSKTMDSIQNIVCSLKVSMKAYEGQYINLAYCHGDFHQGNILADHKNLWILDWEFSGEKQIAYDLIILLLGTRIENGYASRFIKLVQDDLDNSEKDFVQAWPGINWICEGRMMYLLVFLLEDLIFYVEEAGNPLFYSNPNCLDARARELSEIVQYLSSSI